MAGPPAGRVTRNTIVPYPRPGADGSLPPQSPGSPAVAGPGARPVRSRCRPPFVKQIGSSESTGWRNTHGRTPTSRPFVVSRAWARHRRDAKERFPRCSAGRSVRFNHGASRRWQHATTLHRGHGGASRPDHRARPRRRTRNRTRLCPPDGTGAGWDHRSLCDLAADPEGVVLTFSFPSGTPVEAVRAALQLEGEEPLLAEVVLGPRPSPALPGPAQRAGPTRVRAAPHPGRHPSFRHAIDWR